jgi:raffinose/stachyose/melibiose transport system permease protein
MRTLRGFINNSLALIIGLIMITPVYLIFVNAFKTKVQASSMGVELPDKLQWQNFTTVIQAGKLATSFSNGLIYSGGATLLGITLSTLAVYVLSRSRTRFNRGIYFIIIMGIAMPINFVTLTKVMQLTHLINTQLGIIVIYAASHIPIDVFLIFAFIETLPRELDEAAIIDGAGPLQLFFNIIFPLLPPFW